MKCLYTVFWHVSKSLMIYSSELILLTVDLVAAWVSSYSQFGKLDMYAFIRTVPVKRNLDMP